MEMMFNVMTSDLAWGNTDSAGRWQSKHAGMGMGNLQEGKVAEGEERRFFWLIGQGVIFEILLVMRRSPSLIPINNAPISVFLVAMAMCLTKNPKAITNNPFQEKKLK